MMDNLNSTIAHKIADKLMESFARCPYRPTGVVIIISDVAMMTLDSLMDNNIFYHRVFSSETKTLKRTFMGHRILPSKDLDDDQIVITQVI